MALLDARLRALLDRLALAIPGGRTAAGVGAHRSRRLGAGHEPGPHRPYVPGDDARHVDWRVFARHGALALRQFEEDRDAHVVVLLDASASMARGPSGSPYARAAALAAAIAHVATRRGDRVRIVPFGPEGARPWPDVRARAGLPALERALEALGPAGPTELAPALAALASSGARRGLVVVLSDLLAPEGVPEALRALAAAGHAIRLVHVHDDLEAVPDGELELVDVERGEVLRVHVTPALRDAHRATLDAHVDACRRACVEVAGAFVSAPLSRSLEETLRRVLDPTAGGPT